MSSMVDAIKHVPSRISDNNHYRIYMIPGNPGLISFYTAFLKSLSQALQDFPSCTFTVEGQSLGGFSITDDYTSHPLSLQEQINHVENSIFSSSSSNMKDASQSKEQIILIGHSVGAYMLLEVLRRYNARRKEAELRYTIVAGIGLFPTVVDIAKSPTGQKVGWLLQLPLFAVTLHWVAKVLTAVMPLFLLHKIVKAVTAFPEEGVQCVTAFLTSNVGVWQALYMAGDEMKEITTDRWDEDIWGSVISIDTSSAASLYFYFGKNDHWVAEDTREQIIAARGGQDDSSDARWKPKMEVDETGIPHAFCIRHSEQVATKCASFIKNVVSMSR